MNPVEIVIRLIGLIVDLVGPEKAQLLVSEETQRRANAAADAVATARILSGT